MKTARADFGDLPARTLSALVMAAIGVLADWAGGITFTVLVCALVGIMVWELTRMLDPTAPFLKAEVAGVTAAIALMVFVLRLSGGWLVAVVMLSVLLLAWRFPRDRIIAGLYLALILFAGLGLIALRDVHGWDWVLWLVLVVVASDIAGYFAGRLIGGPKLWPRVSPKKTWSGAIAGWICAGAVGWAFMGVLGTNLMFVLISVLVAMAGQAGDMAESAIKRRAGVKDSSSLIPGHGGAMDRFDALIAAALMVFVLAEAGLMDLSIIPQV